MHAKTRFFGPRRRFRCTAVLAAATLALVGCSSMSDTQQTVAQGAGAGAVIGAAIGALTGDEDAAYIGAAAGGVLGGLGGYAVAKTKQGYAGREATLDTRIADVREQLQVAERFRAETADEIARLDADARRLRQQRLSQQARQQELGALIAARERRQRQIDRQVATLEASKRENRDVIGRSRNADRAKTETLERQDDELDRQLDYLKRQSAQLAMIEPRSS